jgi:hypothetical protein
MSLGYDAMVDAATRVGAALGRTISVLPNTECAPTEALCVNVSEDYGEAEGETDCGVLAPPAGYTSDGTFTTPPKIRVRPEWVDSDYDRLARIFAHELTHYFGIWNRIDGSCGSSDTLMGVSPPPTCYDSSPLAPGTPLGPTASDVLIISQIYGNHIRISCGW